MMIEYDTKKVIQEHARLINVSLPSSYRKGEMAEGLATLFQHDPFYTVNQLPMDEQKLIAQLINLNPHCSYPLCNSLISNIRIF